MPWKFFGGPTGLVYGRGKKEETYCTKITYIGLVYDRGKKEGTYYTKITYIANKDPENRSFRSDLSLYKCGLE